MGESQEGGLKLHFDGHLRLVFKGAKVTSDAVLRAVRELDGALGLTETAGEKISDNRTGRNVQHEITGLLKQSVYARLAGYEDVNDREALTRDPAMRAVVGKRALERHAASAQTVSRFETEILTQEENIETLSSINAAWVSKAVTATKTKKIILDMDSSEFPVHGNQESSSYKGHLLKPKSRQYLPLCHLAVVPLRVCIALEDAPSVHVHWWPGLPLASCGPFKTFVRRFRSSRRGTYLRLASPCLKRAAAYGFVGACGASGPIQNPILTPKGHVA